MGNAGQANYAASKAGIIGFTKSIAREYGERNIRVNAVAPGFIRTKMTDALEDKTKAETLKAIPLGRLGEPLDVAHAVYFLLSEYGSLYHRRGDKCKRRFTHVRLGGIPLIIIRR